MTKVSDGTQVPPEGGNAPEGPGAAAAAPSASQNPEAHSKRKTTKGPGRGGKRAGAGRPPGTKNKVTRYIGLIEEASRYAATTPLDLMLSASRMFYAAAMKDPAKVDVSLLQKAHDCAHDAAPFCHPKLLTAEVGGRNGGAIQHEVRGRVMAYVPDNGRILVAANDAAAVALAAGATS